MRRKSLFIIVALLLTASLAAAEIETKTVEYEDGDVVLEGYLARPVGKEARPGVLIVHQWKGLGEFEQGKARALAELGYVAFAVDIYGQGVRPTDASGAGKQAGKYKGDRKLYRQRLVAGLEQLRKVAGVDPKRIGAIGFCFGGTGVLELARSGADVRGVVSFHGGLGTPTPEDARNIKGKVCICHGADDPHVPDAELLACMKEMRDAKVDWQLHAYGGAVHSFTDPRANRPSARYNESADKRSWQTMRSFFAEVLG